MYTELWIVSQDNSILASFSCPGLLSLASPSIPARLLQRSFRWEGHCWWDGACCSIFILSVLLQWTLLTFLPVHLQNDLFCPVTVWVRANPPSINVPEHYGVDWTGGISLYGVIHNTSGVDFSRRPPKTTAGHRCMGSMDDAHPRGEAKKSG